VPPVRLTRLFGIHQAALGIANMATPASVEQMLLYNTMERQPRQAMTAQPT
jgi:hypothetical protein